MLNLRPEPRNIYAMSWANPYPNSHRNRGHRQLTREERYDLVMRILGRPLSIMANWLPPASTKKVELGGSECAPEKVETMQDNAKVREWLAAKIGELAADRDVIQHQIDELTRTLAKLDDSPTKVAPKVNVGGGLPKALAQVYGHMAKQPLREFRVAELAKELKVSAPAIGNRLKHLEKAGGVQRVKRGIFKVKS